MTTMRMIHKNTLHGPSLYVCLACRAMTHEPGCYCSGCGAEVGLVDLETQRRARPSVKVDRPWEGTPTNFYLLMSLVEGGEMRLAFRYYDRGFGRGRDSSLASRIRQNMADERVDGLCPFILARLTEDQAQAWIDAGRVFGRSVERMTV